MSLNSPPLSPLSPIYVDPNRFELDDLTPQAKLDLYASRKAEKIRTLHNQENKSPVAPRRERSDSCSSSSSDDGEEHIYVAFQADSKKDAKLDQQSWWKPTHGKKELANSLHGRPRGAFFIRQSTTRQGDFVIMVNAGLRLYRVLIMRDENGSKYRLAPCAAKLSGPTKKTYFDAITDLVDFFTETPLIRKGDVVLLPDAPMKSWFRPAESRKTTESELMKCEQGEFIVRKSSTKKKHWSLDVSAGVGKKPFNFLVRQRRDGVRPVRWGNSRGMHHKTISDLVFFYTLNDVGKTGIKLKSGAWVAKGPLQNNECDKNDEVSEGDKSEEVSEDMPSLAELGALKRKAVKSSYAQVWKLFED